MLCNIWLSINYLVPIKIAAPGETVWMPPAILGFTLKQMVHAWTCMLHLQSPDLARVCLFGCGACTREGVPTACTHTRAAYNCTTNRVAVAVPQDTLRLFSSSSHFDRSPLLWELKPLQYTTLSDCITVSKGRNTLLPWAQLFSYVGLQNNTHLTACLDKDSWEVIQPSTQPCMLWPAAKWLSYQKADEDNSGQQKVMRTETGTKGNAEHWRKNQATQKKLQHSKKSDLYKGHSCYGVTDT